MIAQYFDELAYHWSWFSVFSSKVLRKIFETKLYEDLIFVFAITLACGIYQYELSFAFAEQIAVALTIISALVWVWVSFVNGFLKRGIFVIFTLLYWIFPQVFIIGYDNTPVIAYNVIIDTASQISVILVRAPVRVLCEFFGINSFIMAGILIIICEGAFSLGFYLRNNARKSVWYSKFRKYYKETK